MSGAKSIFKVLWGFLFVCLPFIWVFMISSFLPVTVCKEAVEIVIFYHSETNSGRG